MTKIGSVHFVRPASASANTKSNKITFHNAVAMRFCDLRFVAPQLKNWKIQLDLVNKPSHFAIRNPLS